jgi:hypothetical protein
VGARGQHDALGARPDPYEDGAMDTTLPALQPRALARAALRVLSAPVPCPLVRPLVAVLALGAGCGDAAGAADGGAGAQGGDGALPAPYSGAADASAADASTRADAASPGDGALADASSDAAHGDAHEPACFEGDSGCARVTTLSAVLADYPSWTRVTDEPQAVSAALIGLCRIPTANEEAFVDTVHGRGLWLQYWLSPLALAIQPDAGELLASDVRYPVGAAIMKEKFTRTPEGTLSLVALGAMIKQPPGFDAAHGDWEYGYWDPDAGWHAAEATAHLCGDCHNGAAADHVFLDFRWHEPDAPLFPGVDAGR